MGQHNSSRQSARMGVESAAHLISAVRGQQAGKMQLPVKCNIYSVQKSGSTIHQFTSKLERVYRLVSCIRTEMGTAQRRGRTWRWSGVGFRVNLLLVTVTPGNSIPVDIPLARFVHPSVSCLLANGG